jgi:hypothetical protein
MMAGFMGTSTAALEQMLEPDHNFGRELNAFEDQLWRLAIGNALATLRLAHHLDDPLRFLRPIF